MANTISGVNLAEVAQESLPALQSLFAPLGSILTDFSTDIAQSGESVTTRFATKPQASDLTNGYTATDVAMTAKTISLNSFQGFVYKFTDAERSKSAINLGNLFLEPAGQALADKVFGDIWDLINQTNFATEQVEADADNFVRNDLVTIGATLSNTLKAPKSNRFLIANPSYYGGLMKSLSGSADILGQTSDFAEGKLPKIAGFDIHESNLCDDNNDNLQAFAGHKSSLLFAGRAVDSEGAEQAGVEVENVVIPEIGLPVQFRRFYNPAEGTLNFSMGLLYGVSAGTGMGVRVVSA
tara:strand:- start:626 stop:1513 length:888 start_codon:yes stop_codon:yes gene_type:complete